MDALPLEIKPRNHLRVILSLRSPKSRIPSCDGAAFFDFRSKSESAFSSNCFFHAFTCVTWT